MAFNWFKRNYKVVVEDKGKRLEIQGDRDFVRNAFDKYLSSQGDPEPRGEPTKTMIEQTPAPRRLAKPRPLPAAKSRSGARPIEKRRFIRLHAMDGGISKVYPIDPKRLQGSVLNDAIKLDRINNIYIEDEGSQAGRLSRALRRDQGTVWHMLVPSQPTPEDEVTVVARHRG